MASKVTSTEGDSVLPFQSMSYIVKLFLNHKIFVVVI